MSKHKPPTVAARKNSEFYNCQFHALTPYIIPSEENNSNFGSHSYKAQVIETTLNRIYSYFYAQGCVPLITWELVMEMFMPVWNGTIKAQQKKRVKKPLTEEDKALCLACLRHYYERYKDIGDRIEQPKGCYHSNVIPKMHHLGIDYRMTGAWDRLDYSFSLDGLIIIEYKVKATELSQRQIEETFNDYKNRLGNIQLGHYAHMVSLLRLNAKVKVCRLILITPVGVYQKEWTLNGIESLKNLAILSSRQYVEMHSECLGAPYEFKCRINAFCDKCNVKEYCLAWCEAEKRAVKPIPQGYFERIKPVQSKYEHAKRNSQYEQLDLFEIKTQNDTDLIVPFDAEPGTRKKTMN